jgi:nitrite reductase/ring-hydroxylating ferredoxin subunit
VTTAQPATQAFTAVATLSELFVDHPVGAEFEGRIICLLRTAEDEVMAFENTCPHRGHPLIEGKCVDGVLRCALHGWEFAIPSGEAVSPRAPFGLELLTSRVNEEGIVEVGA